MILILDDSDLKSEHKNIGSAAKFEHFNENAQLAIIIAEVARYIVLLPSGFSLHVAVYPPITITTDENMAALLQGREMIRRLEEQVKTLSGRLINIQSGRDLVYGRRKD